MKAILRTYYDKSSSHTDKVVEINDNHDFSRGAYVDTIPFAVGSNQTILPLEEGNLGDLTPKEARQIVGRYWGYGDNLPRAVFVEIDERLPHEELPILDRLLSVCGLLDDYNQRNRPAFAAFRSWWGHREADS
jgi:hypothetical protein